MCERGYYEVFSGESPRYRQDDIYCSTCIKVIKDRSTICPCCHKKTRKNKLRRTYVYRTTPGVHKRTQPYTQNRFNPEKDRESWLNLWKKWQEEPRKAKVEIIVQS